MVWSPVPRFLRWRIGRVSCLQTLIQNQFPKGRVKKQKSQKEEKRDTEEKENQNEYSEKFFNIQHASAKALHLNIYNWLTNLYQDSVLSLRSSLVVTTIIISNYFVIFYSSYSSIHAGFSFFSNWYSLNLSPDMMSVIPLLVLVFIVCAFPR